MMKPVFAQCDDIETMYSIFLNCKNRILAIDKMFTGTITHITIYPRELIKRVIELRATGLILVHNHPSGETSPSREDRTLTMKVALAMAGIDVVLHDHVIVGNGYYSMADSGDIKIIMARIKEMYAGIADTKAAYVASSHRTSLRAPEGPITARSPVGRYLVHSSFK